MKIVDALDGLDIKASVLGVPVQITGYENFEFTVFANAIGALYKRNKATERINLLEVDSSTGKGGSGLSSMLVTAGILVGASVAVMAAVMLFLNMKESSIRKEIDSLNTQISECNKIIAKNNVIRQRKAIIDAYATYAKNAKDSLESLPVLNMDKFEKLDKVIKDNNGDYKNFECDITNGVITINEIEVDKQDTVKQLVDAVAGVDFVGEVLYTGYEGTGEEDPETHEKDPVVINALEIYLKGAKE